MIRPMIFPVETHLGGSYHPTPRVVAHFFDWSSAAVFVNAELPERNLYLGAADYRPSAKVAA